MRAYMYSIGLILACVATTALAETNEENADSQVALRAENRALLNDLKVAKANTERQSKAGEAAKATIRALRIDIDAAKATNEASKATQEKALLVAQAAGLNNQRDESGPKLHLLREEEGYGEGAAYGGGYDSKKNSKAATTKTAKANQDAGATARPKPTLPRQTDAPQRTSP